MTLQVKIVDFDGCIAKQSTCWSQLDNRNANAVTPEFIAILAGLEKTPWWDETTFNNSIVVLVTGRLEEHREVSLAWFERRTRLCNASFTREYSPIEVSYVPVPFNNDLGSREKSLADYVLRKGNAVHHAIQSWVTVAWWNQLDVEIDVYDDDLRVLERVQMLKEIHQLGGMLHAIIDGKLHDYPLEASA